MAGLKVVVFDVERGLCVYARTPNGYGLLIDCGRSQTFSPAAWIASSEASSLTTWNGYALAWMIVTHPHDDHVEDIHTVRQQLQPAILWRQRGFNWNAVLNPPDGDPSENAISYYEWQQTYSAPIESYPDLGLSLEIFGLSPDQAGRLDPNLQHLVNNASLVTVLTYWPAGRPQAWKVVIAGDNETAGFQALLASTDLATAVNGADFYITAHHGHTSGFSEELFQAMGQPILNVTSERAGDGSVFDYGRYARGTDFQGQHRSHLTTRRDGHITVIMDDQLKYWLWGSAYG